MQKSEGFSSKIGFVLAAAGSAVGLGNIWRFPYLAAQHGGGIFLLTYLILMLTFGYALLLSENAIGRMTGKGPIGSFRGLTDGKSKGLRWIGAGGYLNALAPLIIVPYYCVIGGWVVKYAAAFFTTPVSEFSKDNLAFDAAGKAITKVVKGETVQLTHAENYFNCFTGSTWEPLIFFFIFVAITLIVVAFGVEKGVERSSKLLMPVLIVLIIGICIYCAFLPNAKEGFVYYLKPDVSKFSFMTVVAAMGQLFYSLSLAMGIMITFGSYMRKEDDLLSSVTQVEIFDTGVAFLAGLMIIPAVVAFGGPKAAEEAGPGLVFITMPQVFASFPGGQFVGTAFFVLVLFAAVTSAISLAETNVNTLCQELKLSRKKAVIWNAVEILGIGTVTVLGYSVLSNVRLLFFLPGKPAGMDILDSLDYVSNSILLPIAAIFTTLLVVAVIGLNTIVKELKGGERKWPREIVYRFCMRFIVIPALILILLAAVGVFDKPKEAKKDEPKTEEVKKTDEVRKAEEVKKTEEVKDAAKEEIPAAPAPEKAEQK